MPQILISQFLLPKKRSRESSHCKSSVSTVDDQTYKCETQEETPLCTIKSACSISPSFRQIEELEENNRDRSFARGRAEHESVSSSVEFSADFNYKCKNVSPVENHLTCSNSLASKGQTYLLFGQGAVGATVCTHCGMLYSSCAEDLRAHRRYCKRSDASFFQGKSGLKRSSCILNPLQISLSVFFSALSAANGVSVSEARVCAESVAVHGTVFLDFFIVNNLSLFLAAARRLGGHLDDDPASPLCWATSKAFPPSKVTSCSAVMGIVRDNMELLSGLTDPSPSRRSGVVSIGAVLVFTPKQREHEPFVRASVSSGDVKNAYEIVPAHKTFLDISLVYISDEAVGGGKVGGAQQTLLQFGDVCSFASTNSTSLQENSLNVIRALLSTTARRGIYGMTLANHQLCLWSGMMETAAELHASITADALQALADDIDNGFTWFDEDMDNPNREGTYDALIVNEIDFNVERLRRNCLLGEFSLCMGSVLSNSSIWRSAPPPPGDSFSAGGECVVALVVRKDLGMGLGKIAAQCAHAAVGSTEECINASKTSPGSMWGKWLEQWKQTQRQLLYEVVSEKDLDAVATIAKGKRLPYSLIMDAGRTQIAAGSKTVVAVGPAPEILVLEVVTNLKEMEK